MSKLTVLTGGDHNQYQVVVHVATPLGNNGAGIPWTTIAAALGNVSALTVGTGPGQILQADATAITAGTLLEASFAFWDDVTQNMTQRLASLDAMGVVAAAQLLSQYQARYQYYGLTRT